MRRALILLVAAVLAVAGGGWLFAATWHLSYGHGLFCSFGTAATTGCDTSPRDGAGQIAAVAVMLTAIPLLAAAFGCLHLDRVKLHVDRRLAEHHRSLSGQIGAASADSGPGRRRARYAAAVLLVAAVLMVRRARR